MRRRALLLVVVGAMAGLFLGTGADTPTTRRGAPASAPVYVQWLRVDAQHPRTLFIGGTTTCARSTLYQYCPILFMRSTDGGVTWADLSRALGIAYAPGACALPTLPSPVQIAAHSRHLYLAVKYEGISPNCSSVGLLRSTDGGLHWQQSGETGNYGGGYSHLAISPVSSNRLYAVRDSGNGGGAVVAYSNDAGRTWHAAGDPTSVISDTTRYRPFGLLFADPTRLNTVYANVVNVTTGPPFRPAFAVRSDDAGVHWTMVMTPTVSPPLKTFTISTNPQVGTLLVGQTHDAGVPADRRYLSRDEGRSWRMATCPGDLHGACPVFIVVNVFGNGAAYAFVGNGIYRFHGGGRAEARLRLSSRLPFKTAALIDVGAGTRAGDPIYLLGRGVRGHVHALLYRSTNGGKSWQQLRY